MSNSDNKDELNGMGCILAALIPLVIVVIGMVLSVATGGATDNLLNIDSREYGSSIFFGFWFLVAVGVVVFLLNRKDNKSMKNPSPASYRNYDSENQYLDDESDYFSPESEEYPHMEIIDSEGDVQKKEKKDRESNNRNLLEQGDLLFNKSSTASRNNSEESEGEQKADLPFCKDYHGNKYRYVNVGEIRWCIDNFKGKQFLSGEEIQEAVTIEEWNKFYKNRVPAFYEHNHESLHNYEIVYNYFVLWRKDLVSDSFGTPNTNDIDDFNQLVNSGSLYDTANYKLIQDSFKEVFTVNIENAKANVQPQKRKFWIFGDHLDHVLVGENILFRDEDGSIPVKFAFKNGLNINIEKKNYVNPGFNIKLCKSMAFVNKLKKAWQQEYPL